MLYVGLDVSRKRIDFHAMAADGDLVERGAVLVIGTGWPGWCCCSVVSTRRWWRWWSR
jgi:hypothetical protein